MHIPQMGLGASHSDPLAKKEESRGLAEGKNSRNCWGLGQVRESWESEPVTEYLLDPGRKHNWNHCRCAGKTQMREVFVGEEEEERASGAEAWNRSYLCPGTLGGVILPPLGYSIEFLVLFPIGA